jgi:hypothetical protein
MRVNWPWVVFLSVIASLIIGYTAFFLGKVYHYVILTQQVPATSVNWSVYSRDEDFFAAQANYTFFVDGKQYAGLTIWDDGERYPNSWALENLMHSLSTQEEWKVWLSTRNPANSSLQKKFPTKECLSTAILWCVFAYLVMLGEYAKRKRSSHGDYRIKKQHPRRRATASLVSSGKGDESDQL